MVLAQGPITSVISYGDICFHLSFLLCMVVDMFLVSSYTLALFASSTAVDLDWLTSLNCMA
jgi:hypothetical protein